MDRIIVTQEELATAMTVWLTVMPKAIWKEYEAYQTAVKVKRQGDRPQVERAVAEFMASQFKQAKWEVSHRNGGNIFEGVGSKSPIP